MRVAIAFAVSAMALTLSSCGGDGSSSSVASAATTSAPAPTSTPAAASAPTASPTPTPSPTPSPSPSPTATASPATSSALPPLDLSDMRLWNYNANWHASEWDNAFSPLAWKFDHVERRDDKAVDFVLDMFGEPELKSEKGIEAQTSGLWEVDVTLPELRDGLVVAPLWLFNQGAKEELDIEFAGRKGLDLSIHANPGGKHVYKTVRVLKGQDLSGRRVRLGIKADIPAGWAEMYLDGELLHRFEKQELGYFVTKETRPVISMWAADPMNQGFVQWVGQWQGITPDEKLVMTVHGYRYTPLAD